MKHIKKIIPVFLFIILLGLFFYLPKSEEVTETKEEVVEEVEETKEEETEEITYKVDIKGSVKKPGVYEVKENTRVTDVIQLAGGLLKDANTDTINLSKKVTDEMVIIIYSNDEITEYKNTNTSKYESVTVTCTCPDTSNDACIEKQEETKTNTTTKININTATKEELTTLSGIGESKAEAIIEYRTETPFQTIEDIKNVSGIGDSAFEKIKDLITV